MINVIRKLAGATPPKDFFMEVSGGFLTIRVSTTINSQRAIVQKKFPMKDLPDQTPATTDNFIENMIDDCAAELDQKAEGKA